MVFKSRQNFKSGGMFPTATHLLALPLHFSNFKGDDDEGPNTESIASLIAHVQITIHYTQDSHTETLKFDYKLLNQK